MTRLTLIVLLMLASSTGYTDFQSGVEAYRENDFRTAFAEFKRLAEAGDPRAQTALALMYKFGEAVDKDVQAAFEWYKKAATADYPPAQFNLAMMYLEGNGTNQNVQSAIEWFKRAGEAGFDRARKKLAELNQEHILSDTQTPSSWSRMWNFRLPNDVRYGDDSHVGSDEGYQVQLGAMNSQQAANYLWEWLQLESGELFDGLNPHIEKSKDQGLYKVRTGPFANLEEAKEFCEELLRQKRDADCYPLPLRR